MPSLQATHFLIAYCAVSDPALQGYICKYCMQLRCACTCAVAVYDAWSGAYRQHASDACWLT